VDRAAGGRAARRAAFAALGLWAAFAFFAPCLARSQARDTLSAAAQGAAAVAASSAAAGDTAAAHPDSAALAKPRILVTVEKRGAIVIELIPDQAPKACERMLALVKAGFYNGLKFHRVESYLVQTGVGESALPPVEGEMFSQHLSHQAGMVGMARFPDNYDSATTQFYIMKEPRPLLNAEYTLFGRVVEGMDVVRAIKKGDTIKSIEVVRGK